MALEAIATDAAALPSPTVVLGVAVMEHVAVVLPAAMMIVLPHVVE